MTELTTQNNSQLLIYQSEDGITRLAVQLQEETVWLSQKHIAELFQTTVPNINLHLKNIFAEGDLIPKATIKDFLIVQTEGNREVNKLLQQFHLDKFNNDNLVPEEYLRVQGLAEDIYGLLVDDGLEPQDMIDVQSFIWSALHVPTDDERPEKKPDTTPSPTIEPVITMTPHPLNQILYGPPGTGKTYRKRAFKDCHSIW